LHYSRHASFYEDSYPISWIPVTCDIDMTLDEKITKFLQKKRINKVLPLVKGKLLDIGCGNNLLVRKYGNGEGVDIHQYHSSVIVINNAAELPFENETYETITMTASLHYISNRIETLKEIHRILKPDGKLIITDPEKYMSKLWYRLRKKSEYYDQYKTKNKTYGFSIKEITDLLHDAGFEVFSIKKFFFNMNRLIIAKK